MSSTSGGRIEIAYGRSHLAVDLPPEAEATVIRKRDLPRIADPAAAIAGALERPIGSAPLAELARGKRSACILICDITRPVPNHLFLRPMIERLLASGVPASGITVLVATGLHRPNEGAELEELVGDPWVLRTVRVVNHFARNDADHVDLGVTPTRGVPIRINRLFAEASCASPPGWSSRISWPAGRAAARSWRPASRTTRRSAPSTPRASWRTRLPSSATSSATRCTRSSCRSCGGWATSTRSTP